MTDEEYRSLCFEIGDSVMKLVLASACLGHKDIRFTAQEYTHAISGRERMVQDMFTGHPADAIFQGLPFGEDLKLYLSTQFGHKLDGH